MCREIEKNIGRKKRVLIFDYSGSYTPKELEKNHFLYLNFTQILDPLSRDFFLEFKGDNLQGALVDAILKALRIQSFHQKQLLREAVSMVVNAYEDFTMNKLFEKLKELFLLKSNGESRKNVENLLTRIEPYGAIKEIHIRKYENTFLRDNNSRLNIIQLSGFAELQRNFFVEFLSELLWSDLRNDEKNIDLIIYDEFQNLKLGQGYALSNMLREGRKFGLSVYLSTQFIGNYDRDKSGTLMQAANMVFFKPTESDLRSIAEIIDPQNIKQWQIVLKNLNVGEAVIRGSYFVNGRKNEMDFPIICKIYESDRISERDREILKNY